jgi:AmiR/NasT family two-component response regulator
MKTPSAAAVRHVLVSLDGFDERAADVLGRLTGWRVSRPFDPSDPELFTRYRDAAPDMLVIDAEAFARLRDELWAIRKVPTVCAGPDDHTMAASAVARGAGGWVVSPPSSETLASQVDLAASWSAKVDAVTAEKQLLAQTLETRKLVERAKAIFMRRLNLDEPAAHKRLQQESQNRRVAIGDLARRIIESEELMGAESMAAKNA